MESLDLTPALAFIKDPRNKIRLTRKDKATSDQLILIIRELLFIAFRSELDIESIQAFDILRIENPFIVESLSLSNFFIDYFTKFPVSDCYASRFCTLIENIITYFPKNADKSIPFFPSLVQYCDQYPIAMSLEKILGARMRCRVFHAYLHEKGFVFQLIKFAENDNLRNEVFGLLNILIQNSLFKNDCKSLEFLELVSDIYEDNTNQWRLLSNLVNEDNIETLSALIPAAINTVHRQEDFFYEYKVHAMNFILAATTVDSTCIFNIEPLVLTSLITEIFDKFYDNSNALHCAETGIFVLMNTKYTRKAFVKQVVPLIKQLVFNYKSVVQRSFIMHTLHTINSTKDRNPHIFDLFDFGEDIIKQIEDWSCLLANPYGQSNKSNDFVISAPSSESDHSHVTYPTLSISDFPQPQSVC
ncbi:hypothetical protein TVAG_495940 [Trichomonas vaginalis G3]|uniref:Serine/threonine-protein phosphatase 4 regulatory subunit 3-like central domain-containing protein n=1 Tax=Trichomonas vaginalis (strain ATCC PRA-98 / G3) TaxID=412133 RepID=A2DVN3_TRIV3|nr:hypothetical protein TVAGG3_0276080 [Trichomonas vaginalis G3]EAY15575.1 hypothetical protein TVAG_495940 [Trichomonas vaginalis G3]KAI5526221.1 hypothetical protein TVAGG3_0276080 [Trichomonas vaginalis G3]|eukprot:XP_001327798.1 hypothetical protein [Trichomonas vaginalis G3]